jgi:hypothetical protein
MTETRTLSVSSAKVISQLNVWCTLKWSKEQWQDLMNSLSMTAPSFISLYFSVYYSQQDQHAGAFWVHILTVGVLLHLPFSMIYHFLRALYPHDEQLLWKWLDLCFIHISSIFYALALSHSVSFTILNALVHINWLRNVGGNVQGDSYKRQRVLNLFWGVLLYTFPVVWRGDLENWFPAMLYMIASGTLYVTKVLGGWSHMWFHLVLVGFQYHLVRAAAYLGHPLYITDIIYELVCVRVPFISFCSFLEEVYDFK